MPDKPQGNPAAPAFELRCGNLLHVTIQHVPGWLVATVATVSGSIGAAWLTSR